MKKGEIFLKGPGQSKKTESKMRVEETGNFFSNIPAELQEEIIEKILNKGSIRIERIISKGHSSPDNFWYDQNENEWVLVLQGQAKLLFEGNEEAVLLAAGDYINIPGNVRHRVEWTIPNVETIWLAVYYG
jgi:cupin 2 domain-containing protein